MSVAACGRRNCFPSSSAASVQNAQNRKEKHMKQKEIKTIPDMLGAVGIIKAAALEHEEGIPLLQNTAVNIGADADALTTARNNHEQSKVVLAGKRTLLAG